VSVSDNGWEQPPDRPTKVWIGGEKGKHSIYDLGFRTPIIFSLPGRIAEGVMRAELVSIVDIFPTLLDFAGVDVPPGRMGFTLRPLLTGRGSFERRQVVGGSRMNRPAGLDARKYEVVPDPAYFLRDSEWRYVWFVDRAEDALYRIEEDPREMRNLVDQERPRAMRYRAEIERWRREARDSMSAASTPPDA
jgi:arylsulfatase A-like enzyme